MAKSRRSRDEAVRGSTNVFADLGYPDAEERQAKLRLAYAINRIIEQSRMTRSAAAELLGVNQPKISALPRYRLDGFSVETTDDISDGTRPRHRDCNQKKASFALDRTDKRRVGLEPFWKS